MDSVTGVAFWPNTNHLFAASYASGVTIFYDKRMKLPTRQFDADGSINVVSFHPSGNTIVVGTEKSSLYAWEIGEGRCLMRGRVGMKVTGMGFWGLNEMALAGEDGRIQIWNKMN